MALKIRHVRSGGFAGLARGATVDVAALAPVASRLVTRLVKTALAAGVKPAKTTKTHGVADLRVHDFVIETDDGRSIGHSMNSRCPRPSRRSSPSLRSAASRSRHANRVDGLLA